MTPQEQQIWDVVHKWCNNQAGEIPDDARRYLMDEILRLCKSERTEGIKEGFAAARETGDNGVRFVKTYPTLEDYLNSKP